MEALEFMRKRKRMCEYYGDDTCVCEDSRGVCPAIDMDCSFTTEKQEQLVAVVEQWAKEHPEKPEQERQKPEQEKRLREMEGQIRILQEKTQKLAESNAMLENKINTLQEAIEEERKEIRLVDAFSMRFAEIECNERGRMEKRLTERIEKLEKGEH